MGSALDAVRDLIESGPLAHLVTVNPDGSPQVTIVWIGIDDDEVVSAHLSEHRKVRNVRRDPRVAISLEAPGSNAVGMRDYAVLYGRARVKEGGAPELLHRLAQVYVGPGAEFPPMPDPPPGYVTRIRVERIAGQGPWVASTE
jgi:PPOX class probable F420-dependent enzyme